MKLRKLDFDEAIQLLADGALLARSNLRSDAQRRFVWVAEWHLPGCLSEAQSICTTKVEAIQVACGYAADDCGTPPRGMIAALRKSERFDHVTPMFGRVVTAIGRHRLGDLLI